MYSSDENLVGEFDVVIVGAGAAGLFCSSLAGYKNLRVLLLEHNAQVGKKILISGGGRCNFTNMAVGPENFESSNDHFAKSALSRFKPSDFIELVERYQIKFYEKKLGQLFCDKTSKDIVNLLLQECEYANVEVQTSTKVLDISKIDNEQNDFLIETSKGNYKSKKVVISSGGLALKEIGASDFGYKMAEKFGLELVRQDPALVPFLYSKFNKLSGVSLPVKMKAGDVEFEDDLLFTHKGFSGPVVLKASLYWKNKSSVEIDFLPNGKDFLKSLEKAGKKELKNFLGELIPSRMAERWIQLSEINGSKKVAELSKSEREKLEKNIKCFEFIPEGTEGYRKAEVTRGGVSTDEISSKSMESKKVPGLYFIGEVVDVTGWLGGYNFQWAWSSAFACSQDL